jgi:hypothetical protein
MLNKSTDKRLLMDPILGEPETGLSLQRAISNQQWFNQLALGYLRSRLDGSYGVVMSETLAERG